MEKKPTRGIWKNFLISAALMAGTFWVIFRNYRVEEILEALSEVNAVYLLLAGGAMAVYFLCDAFNLKQTLQKLGNDRTLLSCVKYSLIGFFFSAVTPSASGGQPMEMYHMKREGVPYSHSSLALLLSFAAFQFSSITLANIAYIQNDAFISQLNPAFRVALQIIMCVNFGVLIFVLTAIFSQRLCQKLVDIFFSLLKRTKLQNAAAWQEKTNAQLLEYRRGAAFLKRCKTHLLKLVGFSTLQLCALHSVPYFIYRAFSLSEHSFIAVFSLQAILYLSVSALPLPGSVGASESGFVLFYSAIFPTELIGSAMLLSRGISFYLCFLLSGGVVLAELVRRFRSLKSGVSVPSAPEEPSREE